MITNAKYMCDFRYDNDNIMLEVYRCENCGFYIGLDASYLLHNTIVMKCPACSKKIVVEEME